MFGIADVRRIRDQVARIAKDFDGAALSGTDAAAVVKDAAAIEKMIATVKALAAKRVEESTEWAKEGHRDPAHFLAHASGGSVGQARESLETAKRMESLPASAAAARRGDISPQQAAAITDAAAVDPNAENKLLAAAPKLSLGELRHECGRVKAAATDAEQRRKAIHAGRSARKRTCVDGAGEITYRSTVDEVEEVWAVVQSFADKQFKADRNAGQRQSFDAHAADGLLAMARTANGRGGEAKPVAKKITVRIDWDAFMRGFPIDGEVCEIAGVGSVPVSAVKQMLLMEDPFLAAVVTKGKDVATVAHLGRKFTAHQQTALEWQNPICSVEGCNQAARLEMDHRDDWSTTKITLASCADRLCDHHHKLKTRLHWKLVNGTGKREMIPPDDARHPDLRGPPPDG